MGIEGLKAVRAVLPKGAQLYMVGGVGPESFGEWLAASANGFGLGVVALQAGTGCPKTCTAARGAWWRHGTTRRRALPYDRRCLRRSRLHPGPRGRFGTPVRGQLYWFDIMGKRLMTRDADGPP